MMPITRCVLLLGLAAAPLSGCGVVGTTVDIATDVVETTVGVTTDVVGAVIVAPIEAIAGDDSPEEQDSELDSSSAESED